MLKHFRRSWQFVVLIAILLFGFGVSLRNLLIDYSRALNAYAASGPETFDSEQGVLNLGCLGETEMGSPDLPAVTEGKVRIRGKLCRRSGGFISSVKVRNLKNGHEGTIFHGVDSSFMTDSVLLETGRNLIEVIWEETKGAPRQSMTREIYQK